jgi:maltose alpha-D-glucosyltransferase/alpha-amylase
MQWSPDRNGGFSRCDPSRLFLPANQDTVGGYEAVNVEAEDRSPFSLLNWMKRMVALRRSHTVFGRGSLEFIGSSNRKVLSYLRRDEHETVLCVANLARTVQPIELHLGEFAGLTPVEMLGQTRFPRVGELPYFLTLAPYGFYWFQLQDLGDDGAAAVHDEQTAEVPSILVGVVWDSLLDSAMRAIIERDALPRFLARQRWFGGKARQLTGARFADWASLRAGAQPAFVTIGQRPIVVLPLAFPLLPKRVKHRKLLAAGVVGVEHKVVALGGRRPEAVDRVGREQLTFDDLIEQSIGFFVQLLRFGA